MKSSTDANNVLSLSMSFECGGRKLGWLIFTVGNVHYNVAMSVSEYYNVGAMDGSDLHPFSSRPRLQPGSMTPTVTGDLLWQWAINAGDGGGLPNSVSSFSAGSQSNITWQLNGTDLYDGDAITGRDLQCHKHYQSDIHERNSTEFYVLRCRTESGRWRHGSDGHI